MVFNIFLKSYTTVKNLHELHLIHWSCTSDSLAVMKSSFQDSFHLQNSKNKIVWHEVSWRRWVADLHHTAVHQSSVSLSWQQEEEHCVARGTNNFLSKLQLHCWNLIQSLHKIHCLLFFHQAQILSASHLLLKTDQHCFGPCMLEWNLLALSGDFVLLSMLWHFVAG